MIDETKEQDNRTPAERRADEQKLIEEARKKTDAAIEKDHADHQRRMRRLTGSPSGRF